MKIFGEKEEFAIGLELYADKYKDDEYFQQHIKDFFRGGEVYFWVKGKNLFEFKRSGSDKTFKSYTLHELMTFFTYYLIDHITEIPFPLHTTQSNAQAMKQETALVTPGMKNELQAYAKLDWDSIDMELRRKKDAWIYKHSFLAHCGACFWPDLMIRKVGEKIEFSWDNSQLLYNDGKKKISFRHKKGVDYVDANLYKETIISFCNTYIDYIKEKDPEIAEKYRKNLQKAIELKY